MSDRTPPPYDLIDLLGEHIEDETIMIGQRVDPEASVRLAKVVLRQLAAWADGVLIDPQTWARITAVPVCPDCASQTPLVDGETHPGMSCPTCIYYVAATTDLLYTLTTKEL